MDRGTWQAIWGCKELGATEHACTIQLQRSTWNCCYRKLNILIFKNLSSWNFSLLLPFRHCFGYIICLFLKNSYDFYIENHPELKCVISPSDIKSWCIRKTIFSHWQKVVLRAESGKLVQLKIFFLLKKKAVHNWGKIFSVLSWQVCTIYNLWGNKANPNE